MQDFAAIDFETDNGRRSSVCSIGVVIVRDGKIVDKFYSVIQPLPNYYTYGLRKSMGLHGRTQTTSPSFSKVRAQLPAATTWRTTIMLLLMQKPVHG